MRTSPDAISDLVTRIVWSPRYRSGQAKRRTHPVSVVVVHTTGYGVTKRSRLDRERWPTPDDAAEHVYGRVMRTGPHYIVGQDGRIVAVMPEDRIAWGVGVKRPWQYRKTWWYDRAPWWPERWLPRGIEKPYQLGHEGRAFAGRSVNKNAVHIEVAHPDSDRAGAPWSDAAWSSLRELTRDICRRHSLPHIETVVVTHSDLTPLSRTARGEPYDPPPSQWDARRLFAE